MPAIPADLRTYSGPGGTFRPEGPLEYFVDGASVESFACLTRANPWLAPVNDVWCGLMIVGLSVKGVPAWKPEDVRHIVNAWKRIPPSFIWERGTWSGKAGASGSEDSLRIAMFQPCKLDGRKYARPRLEAHMVKLGETLCRRLRQDEVILEIQRNGLTKLRARVGP